jgi:hypothetical protein
MGVYNLLRSRVKCPHCGIEDSVEVELFFGFRNQLDVKIGETYPWRPRKSFTNGGRPEGGTVDGEGYAECPACLRGFDVLVHVREDKVVGVEIPPSFTMLPAPLKTSFELLARAFPDGIRDDEYLPVLTMLHPHMCDRNLAVVVSEFTGRNHWRVMNDVFGVGGRIADGASDVDESVRKKLIDAGYDDWAAE